MKRTKFILIIVLVLIAGFWIEKEAHKKALPRIDMTQLALFDLNGKQIIMGQFAGKPLVINFWGSWCGPCLQEIPVFETAGKKFGNQVNIIMISDEEVEKIAAFKNKNNYQLTYVHSSVALGSLGIESVPLTCFYNPAGKLILAKKEGIKQEELNTLIEATLK